MDLWTCLILNWIGSIRENVKRQRYIYIYIHTHARVRPPPPPPHTHLSDKKGQKLFLIIFNIFYSKNKIYF